MAVILVIDDEPAVRQVLRSFLGQAGHDARLASTFNEGCDLIQKGLWDIALVDIVLGEESGIDLLRVAREVAGDCPVLVITGYPTLDSAKEALRLGAFDYIEKPIRPPALFDAVNRALEQRNLLLERRRLEQENLQIRERLEAVFNSVLDGILTVDRHGTLLTLNSAAAALLEAPQDQAVGASLRAVCSGGREAIADAVEKSIRTGEFVREYQIADPTEERAWTHILNITPMQAGTEEHAVVVIRDVSRLRELEREITNRTSFENIIGKSPAMLNVFEMIRNLCDTDTTVLIQGPSGTGKELVASALHYHGARSAGPLVKVNCAALPETLLESELFGHVRGAFTGASRDKIGRFELAHGGTIFLDEIGDVSPNLQRRLLRVLQEREIERVGSTQTTKIDVRVVAATNQDLKELVSRGLFRTDLYYRLNVVTIHLPSLCERPEDIPPLIRHFLRRLQTRLDRTINGIDSDAMEALLHYAWPGNVRELENALEHAVVLSRDGFIHLQNLPSELRVTRGGKASLSHSSPQKIDAKNLKEVLDSVGWNRSRAARRLGIDRTTVWRKIKAYGLTPPQD